MKDSVELKHSPVQLFDEQGFQQNTILINIHECHKDFPKDYMDINQVVQNTTFGKIWDIIPTTKNWKCN